MKNKFNIGVFTKPWEQATPQHVGSVLAPLGVNCVEWAVRDGFYINPKNCFEELPRAVDTLKKYNISINAIGPDVSRYVDKKLIKACAKAGIAYIRIMQFIDMKLGYHQSLKKIIEYYTDLADFLIENKVKIAFQNHGWHGHWVSSPAAIDALVKALPQDAFCTVFEPGHCIMSEPLDIGLSTMKKRMEWISLKTGFFRNISRPTGKEARWEHIWTTHEHGRFSWEELVLLLKKINYDGMVNFFGQYNVPYGERNFILNDDVLEFVKKDITYFRNLVEKIF